MGVTIGLDDVVKIDDFVGYVHFIGADILILVDEDDREYRVERRNIQTVEILQQCNTNELARMEL